MTNIANWKITMLFMGKVTMSMVISNSELFNYQRVHGMIQRTQDTLHMTLVFSSVQLEQPKNPTKGI